MEEKLSLEELTALANKVDINSWEVVEIPWARSYIGSTKGLQISLKCVPIVLSNPPSVDNPLNYTLDARYQQQPLGEETQPSGGSICDLYRKISSLADERLELKRKELCQQGRREARKILGA